MRQALRLTALLLGMVSLLAVAACSSDDPTPTPTTAPVAAATATPTPDDSPQYGGTLAYWIRSDPPGWDPWGRTRFWDPTRKIAELVFNPLYSPGPQVGESCELELQPEIAESWKYVSPTVLEFKIREGIKWHDLPPLNGRALTADDVVYTLNERFVKGLAGKGYVGAEFYDRAEAVDAQTVRVHMKKPFSGFINAFTSGNRQGAIVPPEITSEEDLKDPTKSWVGTGPFVFKEFLSGVKVSFERNPNYFKDGLPYADAIEAHVIPDAATRLAALRSGQINMFPAAGPQALQQVQKTNPDYFIKSCPSLFHMGIRLRLDKEPWSDVRVRRALSMSLDRDAIVSAALRGDGEPVLQAWPLDPEALKLSEFPDEVQQYMQYNPTKAKELLAEAGYPNGFSTTVVWTANYGSPWQEVAETILTMMRAVGINAEFDMHEYGPFLGAGNTLSYDDVYFGWTNSFDFSDLASTYYWSEYQPPNTLSLAPDAHLNEIVARLWASDESTRSAIVKELQIYVADQSYRVTSPVWGNGIMARPEIKNVGWRGTNKMYHQIFENAWIDD
jgi:peptide/nickel transport system substrate-binding protein